jgi:glutamyl-tRNA reductase
VQVVAVGVSHNSSSVSVRERLAVTTETLPEVLWRLRQRVAEAFILSTCNRVELYAVCGHEATGADVLRQFLAAYGNVSLQDVCEASYTFGHQSAVRHLLRVASGLDSIVIGENEILGQVRRALAAARQVGTLGPVLDRLGDAALACGKRVRSSTTLGCDGESVASLGLRLAARARGGLDATNVVVLGAGETAGQVLAHLGALGATRVTVLNRTAERGAALAAAHGAEVRPWDQLASALETADVVIGCTASPTPVVTPAMLARSRAAVGARPVLCLDLGVPRDIDAGVSAIPGAMLVDVDRIQAEAAARRVDRARDLARADAVIVQETERYMEWWRGRGVASTVARLHARADAIRHAEVERALARLPELTPQARAVVGELATRLLAKLLHEPTVALKRDPEGANMAVVVERLFALGSGGNSAVSVPGHYARVPGAPRKNIHEESIAS